MQNIKRNNILGKHTQTSSHWCGYCKEEFRVELRIKQQSTSLKIKIIIQSLTKIFANETIEYHLWGQHFPSAGKYSLNKEKELNRRTKERKPLISATKDIMQQGN